MKPKTNERWSNKKITKAKSDVKKEISFYSKGSDKDRLKFILNQISRYEHSLDSMDLLNQFTYLLSALVHAQKFGGLNQKSCEGLIERARAILKLQGIEPRKSRLCYLYGEVDLIQSQMHRQNGNHIEAIFSQYLSHFESNGNPPGGEGFYTLCMGNRFLRGGFSEYAIREFKLVVSDGMSPRNMEQGELGHLKALRLSGKLEEAQEYTRALLPLEGRSKEFCREIQWEKVCMDVTLSGDLKPMVRSSLVEKELMDGSYWIEMVMWCHATSKRSYSKALPKLQTIIKKHPDAFKNMESFSKVAKVFEANQDKTYPLATRLAKSTSLLNERHHLISIDKEMLLLVALSRWFAIHKAFPLASIALSEYVSICRKLSNGQNSDTLNLCEDLSKRSWFRDDGS